MTERGAIGTRARVPCADRGLLSASAGKAGATAAARSGGAGALGFVWLVVYATNGTSNAFLHGMYVPIIAASLTLGARSGLVTAAAAALLVGPLMPLDVERGIGQSFENMAYRAAFFALIAGTTSGFAAI